MPTKRLPGSANIDHLKRQAKDLLRAHRAAQMSAYQRIREFHPRWADVPDTRMHEQSFSLSDAQLCIAREYGYASWPRLKTVVSERRQDDLKLTHSDRLPDGPFKQALDFMDAGDAVRLKAHLERHPDIIHERATFEGENYFTTPSLLEFLPENPTRIERLPANAVEIAEILLAAGAAEDQTALDETLMLAASGRVCRESGLQADLLRLLCRAGANTKEAMLAALAHTEFDAVRILIDCGAPMDLPTAAALDERSTVQTLLETASQDSKQLALSLAVNSDQAPIVHMLLQAGANPNQYNPPGGHSHCTPLHSAVASGQYAVVVALVEAGADLGLRDIHHGATALDWARHLGQDDIASLLDSRLSPEG